MIAVGIVLVLVLVATARYGADSRFEGTDHRDPALPPGPQRPHTPASDLSLLAAMARHVAAHRRGWEIYDRALRPWECDRPGAPGRPAA